MGGKLEDRGLVLEGGSFLLANGVGVDVPPLHVPNSGLLVVAGPNGAGKTSFATYLCGLRRELPFRAKYEFPTLCWQQPELLPGTVLDNLRFVVGSRKYALGPHSDIESPLRYVDLSHYQKRSAAKISGGQAQRLNIARSLLTSRFGIVLDEPSASLDRQGVEQLITALSVYLGKTMPTPESKWIADLEVDRRYVVCITHDRMLIERLSALEPRFVSIDDHSVNDRSARRATIDAGEGRGYTLNEVRSRPPSLFWAEFFDARNVFYSSMPTPVDSLLQLTRRRPGSVGFVILSPQTVFAHESHNSHCVQGRVRQIEAMGEETHLLVEFQNTSKEVVPIWVHSKGKAAPWMALGSDIVVSIEGSFPVNPHTPNSRGEP